MRKLSGISMPERGADTGQRTARDDLCIGLRFGWGHRMLIVTLTFDVRPDKRTEFLGAATRVVQLVRWSTGCLGCRLVTDCENDNLITFISEWDRRSYLDLFLASPEFQVLEGTRFLLQQGPTLAIDEVISRGRQPGPVGHFR